MENNSIGLNKKQTAELGKKLNELLASYHVYYQNLRGFHWNIKGELFFELHLKFEEYYTDSLLKIDEIAERVLTLETTPLHTFEDYLSHSKINPVKNETEGRKMIKSVLNNLHQILIDERNILKLAQEANDEGTASLISDYISQQEKTIWMLNAFSA